MKLLEDSSLSERLQVAGCRHVPKLQEVIAVFIRQNRIVQMNFGQSRDGAENDILDARLGGGGDGN
jgi:hypothetical protein